MKAKFNSTTFADLEMGGGQFIKAVADKLKRYGHSTENIKGRVFGFSENHLYLSFCSWPYRGIADCATLQLYDETKIKNMEFDAILTNPPYKNGLHMEFFNRCVDLLKDGGHLICLHPATSFINRKPTRDNESDKIANKIVSEYRTRLTLIDGNKLFNAVFKVPLSITHLNKVKDKRIDVVYSHIDNSNKEVNIYDSLDNIFIHGNDIVLKIRDKIFSKMDKSLEDYNTRKGYRSKWYLQLNNLAGSSPKNAKISPDFYCMISKVNETNFNDLLSNEFGIGGNNIGFSNKQSAKNGFEYIKTKFARFCVSLFKINVNLHRGELLAVPYMDFSQEWTDEKLYKHFGLNQDEVDFIESYIGDWYERDFKRKPL